MFHEVEVFGLRRSLPIVPIGPGLWIASDAGLVLSDVEFIGRAGREVARVVKRYDPSVIVTAEAKAIAMAYEAARSLSHGRFVVVRKSVKGYMRSYITENVKSITTREPQTLVLTSEDAEFIRGGKRVCLFDDVVSTGGTMGGAWRDLSIGLVVRLFVRRAFGVRVPGTPPTIWCSSITCRSTSRGSCTVGSWVGHPLGGW